MSSSVTPAQALPNPPGRGVQVTRLAHIAMTPFEQWSEEMRALLNWHGIDPARVTREELWRAFRRGDSAIEAAKLAANIARQEQEAWAARNR